MAFTGFKPQTDPAHLPGDFFTGLLAQIDHLGELKLVLYVLWRTGSQDRAAPFLRRTEIAADGHFMSGLGANPDSALDEALERAVGRGALLSGGEAVGRFVLPNTPRGRAAVQGWQQGKWSPEDFPELAPGPEAERPNIYTLYEKNIGPLTPLLADALREAEELYPYDWILDAFRIAVENNVRKWRYVEAILKSWQEKGRNDRTDQPGAEKDRRKYVEGEFSEFIEH